MSVYVFAEVKGIGHGSSGTGSDALDGKSYVLTTSHGVGPIGTRVEVSAPRRNLSSSPRSSNGTVVGWRSEFDMNMDVAVILLNETHFFGSMVVLSDITCLQRDDEVFLGGCQNMERLPTVINGTVPYGMLKGYITPRYPLSCDATNGASGGGVFTKKGEFLGLLWSFDQDGDHEVKFITPILDRKVQKWIKENNYPFSQKVTNKTASIASTPRE